MFADWVRRELLKLVLRFVSFYNSKYLKKMNNLFDMHHDEVIDTVKQILYNSRRFEGILSNRLYAREYYWHASVCGSLVSLDFKIEFIKKLDRKSPLGADDIDVGLLLRVANTLQQFMYFSIHKSYTNKIDVDRFTEQLGPLHLESTDCCDKEKTLLLN